MAELTIQEPPFPRSPWQSFYGFAHRLRRIWYAERQRRLPVPVVSVGNLHLGGSGKTPLVASMATYFRKAGLSVTILSRGYRRRGHGTRIVSLGRGLLGSAEEAGDEPTMLAAELEGIPIVVGADRFKAGQEALSRLHPTPQILLLDDGFSHLALARDIDILTFPHTDPFAGGRLLPGGYLREPLFSAAAAKAVMLTGLDCPDPEAGAQLARALRPFGFEGPGFSAHVQARLEPPPGDGNPVVLVTGVARPDRVAHTASSLGLEVGHHLQFPDHHSYPSRSLRRIEAACAECRTDVVVTTAKDHPKLKGRLDRFLVELRIRSSPEKAFWRWIDQEGSISNSGSPPSTD